MDGNVVDKDSGKDCRSSSHMTRSQRQGWRIVFEGSVPFRLRAKSAPKEYSERIAIR